MKKIDFNNLGFQISDFGIRSLSRIFVIPKSKINIPKCTIAFLIVFLMNYSWSFAQCAMCRATVGSNLSEGRGVIGTGINDGILLMLAFTYLSIPTLVFVWFRTAKKEMRLKMSKEM